MRVTATRVHIPARLEYEDMSVTPKITKRTDHHCTVEYQTRKPKQLPLADCGAPFNIPHTSWWKDGKCPSREKCHA